jgi:hypothetical protein
VELILFRTGVQGLGTSDAADAKKYFGDMARHRLPFKVSTAEDRALIDMAFNKKKADDRKEWLRGFVVRILLLAFSLSSRLNSPPLLPFSPPPRHTARYLHGPRRP